MRLDLLYLQIISGKGGAGASVQQIIREQPNHKLSYTSATERHFDTADSVGAFERVAAIAASDREGWEHVCEKLTHRT